jgi:amino acid permease
MLNIIVVLILGLLIIILSHRKKDFFQSRPNCPQLNKPEICSSTPGCFSTSYGCINNYRSLQEPPKRWEKDDFMIIY